MLKPSAAVLILFTSLCANALAGEVRLKSDHPAEYQVKQGDSLWSIAGKFLHKPGEWPKIWQSNAQIQNPDFIFPGDKLGVKSDKQNPQIYLLSRGDIGRHYEKIVPVIREKAFEEAIKLIPSNAIFQFLSSPRVVNKDELTTAPYVLEFEGEHIVAGAGDKVYVRGMTDASATQYYIYRPGEVYLDPETQEILGYEAVYVADGVIQQQDAISTLKINKASMEIREGDRVMPNSASNVTLNYFPRPPQETIRGHIIGVLNGVTQIGQYNIVILDKGSENGLAAGHVLDIHQRGRLVRDNFAEDKNTPVSLPEELSGSLMVFRTFERVSYALVMQANQAIHVLDSVSTP